MRRTNFSVWDTVESAIELCERGMLKEAAKHCKDNNIPIDIAFRVLTKPKQRRKSVNLKINIWDDLIF